MDSMSHDIPNSEIADSKIASPTTYYDLAVENQSKTNLEIMQGSGYKKPKISESNEDEHRFSPQNQKDSSLFGLKFVDQTSGPGLASSPKQLSPGVAVPVHSFERPDLMAIIKEKEERVKNLEKENEILQMKMALIEEETNAATVQKFSLSSNPTQPSVPESLTKLLNDVQALNRQLLAAIRS